MREIKTDRDNNWKDETESATVDVVNPNENNKIYSSGEELQNEPKVFVNCIFCQLTINIIFTYLSI